MSEQLYQKVIIELNDGTKLIFYGKAQVFENDKREIKDIHFTQPMPLPDGYQFKKIELWET